MSLSLRHIIVILSFLPLAAECGPREWQVAQDYVTLIDADPLRCMEMGMPMGQRVNPFLSYTGLGTDFGFIGPGEKALVWMPGHICVELDQVKWGGMWHSLSGMASDSAAVMDFEKAYPPFIKDEYQPKIVGLRLRGHGNGPVKIEIKDAGQSVLWAETWQMDHGENTDFIRPLPVLHNAKFLNWVSECGCHICVDQISLEVQMPEISTDLRVFLKSFVKLAQCYSKSNGLVKDRAHIASGTFDSIPASGMFCLAAAVAQEQGIVSAEFARQLIHRTHEIVSEIPTASGLLPHFVSTSKHGIISIHPNTEYSSVDSAIYFHSMLIAAQILQENGTANDIVDSIRRIRMDELLDASGHVIHGFNEDGSRIPASWQDWGGETALVLLFQHIALGDTATVKMKMDGKAWQSTGFIPEIQSLFFPGFDTTSKDRVSGQNWGTLRKTYLERQRDYFQQLKGPLEGSGIFGLSAGEGRRGMGYLVSGTDLTEQIIIHPHYMLMSACHWDDTTDSLELMEKLEDIGALPPWGMVENIDTESSEMLPMLGSLNAGFECLAAYHLLAKHRKHPDAIYNAVHNRNELATALRLFYP